MALVADLAVGLVLLAGGVIAGEEVVGKGTGQVMEGADPMDLVLWAAPPAVLVLAYLWLGTRGRTVGGWLARRAV